MRKFTLPFLGLILDFFWIDAAVGLIDQLFPGIAATILGQSMSWSARIVVSLALLSLARLANLSVGDWLLHYALTEREAGVSLRQWPNLLLGTIGFLSAIWQLVQLTQPSNGMPFLFMVEDTPLKMLALALHAAFHGWGGAMLLRFAHRARLFNAVLFSATLPLTAINYLFFRDAMVAAMMVRPTYGPLRSADQAERIVAFSPIYAVVLVAMLLAILYFCRERPAPARQGAPASPA
ncbi:hypothetical protein [Mesorhizobium caraganae]|uniref:hypothetical protein n=1 Tax=Mesorhizobium caraganae TaxID=483206 RepID=UPI00333CF573